MTRSAGPLNDAENAIELVSVLPRRRPVRTLAAAVLLASLTTACSSADSWSRPRAEVAAVGSLGAGYTDPVTPPTPEATITPRPGSWDAVHPGRDYRVVLLTTNEDRKTRTLADAVTAWAEDEGVSLKTVNARTTAQGTIPDIQTALALKPHLIISTGEHLIDPLTLVSANHLDQQFLVIGAELPEPTHNVTSAEWEGATFRGAGLNTSSDPDPSTFTPERAGRAVRAGVAAVLHGLTGIVIWLD